MRWRVVIPGRPRLAYARAGVEEYLPRIRSWVSLEYLRPRGGETESQVLLRSSEGAFRVVLDETGTEFSSRDLAGQMANWELRPQKEVCFLIGGASGHEAPLVEKADCCWSLGKITLQHELALVVLLEQLYRAASIRSGSPYHRD